MLKTLVTKVPLPELKNFGIIIICWQAIQSKLNICHVITYYNDRVAMRIVLHRGSMEQWPLHTCCLCSERSSFVNFIVSKSEKANTQSMHV